MIIIGLRNCIYLFILSKKIVYITKKFSSNQYYNRIILKNQTKIRILNRGI